MKKVANASEPAAESMCWVIACLVMLAAWMAVVLYEALPLSSGGKSLGGCLLAIGALQMLFYKRTGRRLFAQTQSSRPFVARFWARIGEREVQLFYLGVGSILAVGGCILLVFGSA